MFGLESFILKIITVITKKAIVSTLVKGIITAFEVYSVLDTINDAINCITTTNDCKDLGLCGISVASDQLTDKAFDKIIQIGDSKYTVERTKSGIYVANNYIPTIKLVESHEIGRLFNSSEFIKKFNPNQSDFLKKVDSSLAAEDIENRIKKLR